MENSPYLVHSLCLHDMWSEQVEFNIVFWLLSTVLFDQLLSISSIWLGIVFCCTSGFAMESERS